MQDISVEVWEQNYKAPGESTVQDTWERLARAGSSIESEEVKEKVYQDFKWLFTDFKGIPGGRITANLGIPSRESTTLMNCVSAETLVQTKLGVKLASELTGKSIDVRCVDGVWRNAEWKSYGLQQLYKVTFSDGFSVRATAGHEWYVNSPKGLKIKKTTELLNKQIPYTGDKTYTTSDYAVYVKGVRHGAVYGDGFYCNTNKYCIINLFGAKKQLINEFFPEAAYQQSRDNYQASHIDSSYKSLPTNYDIDYIRGFIAGLMSTDGHVDKRGACYFSSSDLSKLETIRHLCALAGCPASPIRIIRKSSNFGDYAPNYGFNIFRQYVDGTILIRDDQRARFDAVPKSNRINSRKVVSVDIDLIEEVFCCEEPITHSWALADGTVTKNCFVHNPYDINYNDPDSVEGIYSMLKAQAHTLKSEGGYGMNFSWIRPAGMHVKGIGGRTPGVLTFMNLWNVSSAIITMGSDKILGPKFEDEKKKMRKGAQMGIIEIWHPEIEDFIDAKLVQGRLDKFNLSIGVTEGFMEAVERDGDWDLIYPVTTIPEYKTDWHGNLDAWLAKKLPVTVYKTVKAAYLWEKVMKATYTRNDPGVLFLDLANKLNPLAYNEKIATTNPCGEIAMSTGVCNLLSINLAKHIKKDGARWVFDYDSFKRAVATAVRFSDNINDISRVPLDEYKASMQDKRRIGIGVLALGSLHYILGIRFGSADSLELIDNIFKAKAETEIVASAELGKEKGSFKFFNHAEYFDTYWWKTLPISQEVKTYVESIGEMRNSHRSANAPRGNMSVYAEVVSGGIEPCFLKEYVRWSIVSEAARAELREKGLVIPDIHKGEWFETDTFKSSKRGTDDILKGTFEGVEYEIDRNRGLIKASSVTDYGWLFVKEHMPEMIEEWDARGVFATTDDLNVDDHLNTLKIIAKYTDMNSSKTVNLPGDYSYDDFQKLYTEAWKSGIKGITTYRAGTMTVVLEKKEEVQEQKEELENFFEGAGEHVILGDVELPEEYHSKGYIIRDNNRKKWYVNIAFADKALSKPFALFVNTNSTEGTEVTDHTISSLMELANTKGIREELIIDQSKKFHNQTNVTKIARTIGFLLRHNVQLIDIVNILDEGNYPLSSFTFHIKRLLKQFIKDGMKVTGKDSDCPKCGGEMIFQEGCILCKDCSWSKCG